MEATRDVWVGVFVYSAFSHQKNHMGKLLRDLNTKNQHRFPSKACGLAGMHRDLYRREEVGVSTPVM